jgi:hypothetical protein
MQYSEEQAKLIFRNMENDGVVFSHRLNNESDLSFLIRSDSRGMVFEKCKHHFIKPKDRGDDVRFYSGLSFDVAEVYLKRECKGEDYSIQPSYEGLVLRITSERTRLVLTELLDRSATIFSERNGYDAKSNADRDKWKEDMLSLIVGYCPKVGDYRHLLSPPNGVHYK